MKKIFLIICVIAFAGSVAWFLKDSEKTIENPAYIVGALSKEYTSDVYHFSLKTPEEFAIKEAKQEEGTMITIEDLHSNGVQVLISPFDEDVKVLTEERIKQDVPDLKISDTQPIDIGDEYKGLAFKSDNEAFDGASREVWFVFRGNLYQISTYERLDPLLKSIFATWKFF